MPAQDIGVATERERERECQRERERERCVQAISAGAARAATPLHSSPQRATAAAAVFAAGAWGACAQ